MTTDVEALLHNAAKDPVVGVLEIWENAYPPVTNFTLFVFYDNECFSPVNPIRSCMSLPKEFMSYPSRNKILLRVYDLFVAGKYQKFE